MPRPVAIVPACDASARGICASGTYPAHQSDAEGSPIWPDLAAGLTLVENDPQPDLGKPNFWLVVQYYNKLLFVEMNNSLNFFRHIENACFV